MKTLSKRPNSYRYSWDKAHEGARIKQRSYDPYESNLIFEYKHGREIREMMITMTLDEARELIADLTEFVKDKDFAKYRRKHGKAKGDK